MSSAAPRPRWPSVAYGALGLVAAVEFYWCIFHCDNDFLWHRFFGRAFLHNEVYEGFGQHYLPARAMLDAVTAWMPYRIDRLIWLIGACAALAWCVRFWASLGDSATQWRAPAVAALLITAANLHRDLAECGLQLFLLAFLSVGLWALIHARYRLCGAALGMAVVYKVTPVLFLPYLVWKRQWRAAGWTVIFALAFCLLPALFVGWRNNVRLHTAWLTFALDALALDDPSQNGVEPPTRRNQSLPLLIARQLQQYPPEHPLYVEHTLLPRSTELTPRQAKHGVQIALAAMALALAFRMRHKLDAVANPQSQAAEWSVVCVFIALLSPLCWLQHLVLVIPAAMLLASRIAARRARPWQVSAVVTASTLTLIVHRDLLGQTLCDALSALEPHAVACLFVVAAVLGSPLPEPRVASQTIHDAGRDLRHAA